MVPSTTVLYRTSLASYSSSAALTGPSGKAKGGERQVLVSAGAGSTAGIAPRD